MEKCLDAVSKWQTIYFSSLPAADNELVGNFANTFMRVELGLFGPCLVFCPYYRFALGAVGLNSRAALSTPVNTSIA